ncbi:hypothetical protein [Frondihabitans sp. 762G35]|uniref:hypothetical protein n=1 Tax=Frondihabitans sp. 762G35 TaxID=1446794 RepID=UPI0013DD4EC0|nr:hypothetical protein [Frondihabitans sp. 762G35]
MREPRKKVHPRRRAGVIALGLSLFAASVAVAVAAGGFAGAQAATAGEPRAAGVTVLMGGDFVNTGTESRNISRCVIGDVLVGRQHAGDENGPTFHRCASVRPSDPRTHEIAQRPEVVKSEWITESSGVRFTCPTDTVLFQRMHVNDENGQTQYRCRSFDLVSLEGGSTMRVVTSDPVWSSSIKESAGTAFSCPRGQAMTGRFHTGDENGSTEYQCSSVGVSG